MSGPAAQLGHVQSQVRDEWPLSLHLSSPRADSGRRGVPEELEVQLEQLHDDSFGWALSCCGWNEADAEDVLQTTYLKVVSRRARFGGKSTFKTWLFGVIMFSGNAHSRKERSRVRST